MGPQTQFQLRQILPILFRVVSSRLSREFCSRKIFGDMTADSDEDLRKSRRAKNENVL